MTLVKKISAENIPRSIAAVVFDFDGVFTCNKVISDQFGVESIECWRGDGLGIAELKKTGIPTFILSHERNSASYYRAQKLGIRIQVTTQEKNEFLSLWAGMNNIDPMSILFLGNDVNDISAMKYVGISVAVNDAHPKFKAFCRYETLANGGMGAVREICDLVVERVRGFST